MLPRATLYPHVQYHKLVCSIAAAVMQRNSHGHAYVAVSRVPSKNELAFADQEDAQPIRIQTRMLTPGNLRIPERIVVDASHADAELAAWEVKHAEWERSKKRLHARCLELFFELQDERAKVAKLEATIASFSSEA